VRAFTSVFGTSWLQGRQLIPILQRHGAVTRGTVLDLGCGRSPLRPLFAQSKSYIRMDRYAVDKDVIVITDISDLPLAAESVDVVILSRMLGDLPDLPSTLRELSRVIAPDGRILIYEAISYPQHDLPHDYWRVLPAGLEWAAGRSGLRVAEMEYLGGYFTQLAMHWNHFVVGDFGLPFLRPFAALARAFGNVAFAGLDRLVPRPALATDYFACLTKTEELSKGRP
jgi:SAM-dependent methyltransferase